MKINRDVAVFYELQVFVFIFACEFNFVAWEIHFMWSFVVHRHVAKFIKADPHQKKDNKKSKNYMNGVVIGNFVFNGF